MTESNIPQPPGGVTPVQPTTFAEFWKLGYTRLVPIIPPDATISPNSSLAKRKDARGKAPGVRGREGWYGYDFVAREADESDIARWQAMGAGIGIKTGLIPGTKTSVLLIDADTKDADSARIIRDAVEAHFGRLPIRVGNYPKAGYLIACDGEFRYTRVEFGELDDKGRLKDRCEILSDGRQFVAHGVHPVTGNPYTWPRAIVPLDDLPRTTPDALLAFMEALRIALPAAKPLVQEGAAADVNQASLRGSLEHIRKAVEATPNTSAVFPTREDYIKFGYAIKAALPDDEEAGKQLFGSWSDRWVDGDNPDGFAEAEWRRMKPPFKVGAPYLYELAEKHGDGSFSIAEVWFSPVNDNDNPFEALQAREEKEAKRRDPIRWIDPALDWEGVEPKPREWEVEHWIPRHHVTILYGDGGVGKTLLAHQYAICAAAGLDWLGQPTRQAKVMCFFCEDGEDELHRRQRAITRQLGVDLEPWRLSITSRCNTDNALARWDRNTGEMKPTDLWWDIRRDALAFGAEVIILDTLADIYAGSEIDRGQVTAFVRGCLGRLGAETGASIIVLGHPSMSGKSSGSGTSGSTAWSNSVRSRLYLRRQGDNGNFRELEGMKTNYAKQGNLLKLRWNSGAFDAVAGNVAPAEGKVAPGVIQISDAVEKTIADVMITRPQIRLNMLAGRYAAWKVLKREDPDAFAAYSEADIEAGCRRMVDRGALREGEIGRDTSYRPITGLVLVADKLSDKAGVFE